MGAGSGAIARFAKFLTLSDDMLARAERDDLEECAWILAVQCAHNQSKYGRLPMSETLEVLNSETMNDTQAQCIADGFEMVVAELGVLENACPKH